MFAKKIVTFSNALEKIKNYCAYQERSHAEVKSKLFSWGLHTNEVNQTVAQIILENFLNEERYAKALVSGKFKIKKWGKNKIIAKLKFQNVSKYCINRGLLEIDEAEYKKTFLSLLIKKWETSKEINIYKKKGKVARFLIGRGYETELVYSEINKLVND